MSPNQMKLVLLHSCRGCGVELPEYPGVGRPRRWCDDCYPDRAPRRVSRASHEVPAARRSDPVTSHQAAAAVDGEAVEARILEAFEQFGWLNDSELCEVVDGYGPTIRTARSRLTKAGCLIDTGTKRQSSRGRPSIVWAVAP